MRIHSNFGDDMPENWQDRKNAKEGNPIGFYVSFADGFTCRWKGGLIALPESMIKEHGRVVKAKEIA